MLRLSFIFCLCTILLSCNKPAPPSFKMVKNLELTDITLGNVTLKGDAVLHNPNSFSIKVQSADIDVFADDIALGKVKQPVQAEIPANSDFSLPLVGNFSPKDIFGKGNLGGMVNIFANKKFNMHYKGHVVVDVAGVGVKVPIDAKQPLEMGKK